ncbi:solute carrier organic anion transporter family member 4A1 isoform X2 [Osmerus eperlanus]|uniref:solute carrier organic anion transporter family member 4A1 isoform X2 n=1 Tax=Osmerus eperlanus TaxID=29151 RepID=UPI002E0D727F
MPVLLNGDASFSSKQELLDLQDWPPSQGASSLDTPSPVDSQAGSPLGSDPESPGSPSGDASSKGARGLLSQPSPPAGHPYGPADPDTPLGVKFVPEEAEQLCGWGRLTPRAVQAFNTPRWVLFFLCVASFLQGMIVNGFINTVVTSIERRFDLRSYQAGLIASSYDIAACVCLAFVSYFGGTGHRPRWLGWGVLVMALGSLVFALPHFTTPAYQVSKREGAGLCSANRSSPCLGREGRGLSDYRYVFMLGQFLHGVGATPLYTLGVTYLDENVKSSYAPVYIGIFYTAAIVGPAAGYLLGGYFLNIYTEIHQRTELTPENPLWVGAWWVGFLAGGAAALLIALPILGYPRQLPGYQEYQAMRVSEAHQLRDGSQVTASDPQFGKSVKDMPRSVLLLLKNPPFLFLCLAGATEATLIAGMSTFGPKFLESQFSLSASEAATWFVPPSRLHGGTCWWGGHLPGGLHRQEDEPALPWHHPLLHAVCPGQPAGCLHLPCPLSQRAHGWGNRALPPTPEPPLPGPGTWVEGNLTAACNSGCSCVRERYNPVCGADGVMYYSPCHAGCTALNHTDLATGRQVFSSCGCVGGNVSWEGEGLASAGKCSSTCHHMPAFLIFLFLVISFTFLCSIPALTATLRCVPDSQRSFGLGIQWIVVRTLGGIPGPIAFGSVIDISCLLWQDQCGEQGSCYLYHNSAMSRYTLIAGIIYKVLGTVFFLLASVLYQPPPESPHSSCDSTDPGVGGREGGREGDGEGRREGGGDGGKVGEDCSDLPIKDHPLDHIITNEHARL